MKKLSFIFFISLFFPSCLLTAQFNDSRDILPSITDPTDIKVGDLDGDGDEDIISSFGEENKLVWYENENGLGRFLPEKRIVPSTNRPKVFFIADIDLDGDLDIVLGKAYELNAVVWFENDGTGTFGEEQIISTSGLVKAIHGEDLDNDGDIDVIVSSENRIVWFENEGNGAFASASLFSTDYDDIYSITTGDIDGDDNEDIFFSSRANNVVAYIPNNGSGNFGNIIEITTDLVNPGQVTLGDIDSDSDLDLVTASLDEENMYWYKNENGLGSFGDKTKIGISPNNPKVSGVRLADFDDDGDLDILTAISSVGTLSNRFYENTDGLGDFQTGPLLIDDDHNFNALSIADFNGDNMLDVVALGEAPHVSVIWFQNLGSDFNFSNENIIAMNLSRPAATHFFDIDGDDDIDFVAAYGDGQHGDSFLWFENLGGNQYIIHVISDYSDWDDFDKSYHGDIDGDGDNDLVAIGDGELWWFENTDGKGNFIQSSLWTPISGAYIAEIIDIDADGDLDVVCASGSSGDELFWFENEDGQGTFGNHLPIAEDVVGQYNAIYFHDLDNDGDLDIVTGSLANFGQNQDINWHRNEDGAGTFSDKIELLTDQNVVGYSEIAIVDIDNDLDNDIVYRSESPNNEIQWAENDGNGNFSSIHTITLIDDSADQISSVDLDNDGDNDIIFSDVENQQNIFYLNQDATGTFEGPFVLDFYMPNNKIFLQDTDGDSDLDIVIESRENSFYESEDAFVWHENIFSNLKISGYVYFDENENGIFDSNEIPLDQQKVFLDPSVSTSWSSNTGNYNFPIDPGYSGDYSLTCQPTPGWALTTDEEIIIDPTSVSVDSNFGLTPETLIDQASIDLSSAATRCGFSVPFWLNYENTGTTYSDGTISIKLDPLSTFIESNPMPDEINGDILVWNFEDLPPSYSDKIKLQLQMASADFIGSDLSFKGEIELVDNNNDSLFHVSQDYTSVLNCAYDPNDKLVEPSYEDFDNYTLFTDSLIYTVRFQNTGTDTAFNVRIEDVLDPNLDWATLDVIAASHNYEVLLNDNGKVIFYFNDILLPDSTTNLIESNGFIKYEIKPKQEVDDFTPIYNTAAIFFDFNEPIYTNQTENILAEKYPVFSTITPPSCSYSNDGIIQVIFPLGNYFYQWDNGSEGIENSTASTGDNNVIVTNIEGEVIAEEIISVDDPEPIKVFDSVQDEDGSDMNGSISLFTVGGTPSFTFEWNTTPAQTTESISNLSAGDYTVTITDANDCLFMETFVVDQLNRTDNLDKERFFSIVPNPSNGLAYVELYDLSSSWNLMIYNAIGERILFTNSELRKNSSDRILIEGLGSGIYLIVLEQNGKLTTKELIVQNSK
ncbi:T9SS type A sorting domain-containing protein [Saprospiraceae bacterium]|nr:T9SS type A sorting domain-containing protein [Saprospiraceae bacterium]